MRAERGRGGEGNGKEERRGEKDWERLAYRLHSYRGWGGDKALPMPAWGHEFGSSLPMQKLREAACI